MELFSLQYVLFIFILLVLYYVLPRALPAAARFGWVILLAASVGYYAFSAGGALLILLLTAFTVWRGGRLLADCDAAWRQQRKEAFPSKEAKKEARRRVIARKRRILAAVLLLNFGILAALKYAAPLLGLSFGTGGLLLPLGISFYTFQAASYLIDQYNGKYPAEPSFLHFLLFISWFPQLLQGPIGRYDSMREDLFTQKAFDRERTKRALLRILYGLLKKYVIADLLTGSIAAVLDQGNIGELPGSLVVLAILLYSAQQYGDFSGGIDIVTGVSALFGIGLAPNFRQPYFAVSLGDFWRRWHISLGAWMRDYLFYPFALLPFMQRLGKWCTRHFGSRGKHLGRVLPAGISNLLVFAVVGIWHGPELHYLLWGLYNGAVIALSDLTEPFWRDLSVRLMPGALRERRSGKRTAVCRLLRTVRTFLIVNIGWYFDRITDVKECLRAFAVTLTHFCPGELVHAVQTQILARSTAFNLAGSWTLALLGVILVFAVSLQTERGTDVYRQFQSIRFVPRMCIVVLLLLLVAASFLFTETSGGFLYANF